MWFLVWCGCFGLRVGFVFVESGVCVFLCSLVLCSAYPLPYIYIELHSEMQVQLQLYSYHLRYT